MFNRQMKKYNLEIPQTAANQWNEPIVSYVFDRVIEMAICLNNNIEYNSNDMDLTNLQLVGITKDRNINKGDRIGGKYLVSFVEENRTFSTVYMKEVENIGRF